MTETFECPKCKKTFKTRETLKKHDKLLHQRTKIRRGFQCEECNSYYDSKESLAAHVKSHSNPDRQCKLCDKSFLYPNRLKLHLRTHQDLEKTHICTICDKAFDKRDLLNHHINHVHKSKGNRYACKTCEYIGKSKQQLEVHEITHTDERPFPCKTCDKSFKRKDKLRLHEKIHSGERPHICPKCPNTFYRTTNLKQHLLDAHSDVRKYECDKCGAKFKRLRHLAQHSDTNNCLNIRTGKGKPKGSTGSTYLNSAILKKDVSNSALIKGHVQDLTKASELVNKQLPVFLTTEKLAVSGDQNSNLEHKYQPAQEVIKISFVKKEFRDLGNKYENGALISTMPDRKNVPPPVDNVGLDNAHDIPTSEINSKALALKKDFGECSNEDNKVPSTVADKKAVTSVDANDISATEMNSKDAIMHKSKGQSKTNDQDFSPRVSKRVKVTVPTEEYLVDEIADLEKNQKVEVLDEVSGFKFEIMKMSPPQNTQDKDERQIEIEGEDGYSFRDTSRSTETMEQVHEVIAHSTVVSKLLDKDYCAGRVKSRPQDVLKLKINQDKLVNRSASDVSKNQIKVPDILKQRSCRDVKINAKIQLETTCPKKRDKNSESTIRINQSMMDTNQSKREKLNRNQLDTKLNSKAQQTRTINEPLNNVWKKMSPKAKQYFESKAENILLEKSNGNENLSHFTPFKIFLRQQSVKREMAQMARKWVMLTQKEKAHYYFLYMAIREVIGEPGPAYQQQISDSKDLEKIAVNVQKVMPPTDEVKTEEMLNFFDEDDAMPRGDDDQGIICGGWPPDAVNEQAIKLGTNPEETKFVKLPRSVESVGKLDCEPIGLTIPGTGLEIDKKQHKLSIDVTMNGGNDSNVKLEFLQDRVSVNEESDRNGDPVPKLHSNHEDTKSVVLPHYENFGNHDSSCELILAIPETNLEVDKELHKSTDAKINSAIDSNVKLEFLLEDNVGPTGNDNLRFRISNLPKINDEQNPKLPKPTDTAINDNDLDTAVEQLLEEKPNEGLTWSDDLNSAQVNKLPEMNDEEKPLMDRDVKLESTLKDKEAIFSINRTHEIKSGEVNKPHICVICNKSFRRRANLRRHEASHEIGTLASDGERPGADETKKSKGVGKTHLCDICNKRVRHPKRHSRAHERGTITLTGCRTSARKTQEKMKTLAEGIAVKCLICSQQYDKLELFDEHKKSTHPDYVQTNEEIGSYVCLICGKEDLNLSVIKRHAKHSILKGHGSHQTCPICDKKVTKGKLQGHIRFVHQKDRPHTCQVCQKSFQRRSKLIRHERTHEKSSAAKRDQIEGPHTCQMCQKSFEKRSNLIRHERAHKRSSSANGDSRETKSFKCKICGKALKTKIRLERHEQGHEEGTININGKFSKMLKCTLCEFTCKYVNILDIHMRKHTGDKPHTCKTCNKSYSQVNDLYRHERAEHLGERPYSCKLCNFASARRNGLDRHMVVHGGETHYKCEKCGKDLKRSERLKWHLKKGCLPPIKDHVKIYVNDDNAPYKCGVCHKQFTREDHLKRHEEVHTDLLPYKCELCGRSFRRKESLKRHKEAVHTGKMLFNCAFCKAEFNKDKALQKHRSNGCFETIANAKQQQSVLIFSSENI